MAESKEKGRVQDPVEALKAELEGIKGTRLLEKKYGANLTEQQKSFYREQERKAAIVSEKHARNRENEAAAKREAAAKDPDQAVVDLLESGRLRISVSGKRVLEVIACPLCGGGLPMGQLRDLAGVPEGQRLEQRDIFHVNHLFQGLPLLVMPSPCGCGILKAVVLPEGL